MKSIKEKSVEHLNSVYAGYDNVLKELVKEGYVSGANYVLEEIEKLKSQLLRGACSSQIAMETRCKEEAYNEVLAILDTMQEEPVSGLDNGDMPIERWKQAVKAASNQRNYRSSKWLTETRDDYFVDGVQWADEHPKKEHVSEEWIEELRTKLDSMSKEEFRTVWEKYGAEYEAEEKEEPVSEELEEAIGQSFVYHEKHGDDFRSDKQIETAYRYGFETGANWQKQKDSIVSEDLEELINSLSKRYPEMSFAKLSRIAVRVSRWQRNQDVKNKLPKVISRTDLDEYAYQCAYDMSNDWAIDNPTWHDVEDACKLGAKWQKGHLWKPADGDDLPEIDREVVVLIKYGAQHNIHDKEYFTYRVGFGHRPNPNGWDGKNIDTNEVTHYTPKLYDKGGWNAPNIVYWLDVELPKEIEL